MSGHQSTSKKQLLIVIVLLSFSLGSQLSLHRLITNTPHFHTKKEDLKYLPSGNFLKGAALSYDEMLADLLWIKAISYFGEHYVVDQDYTWLHHILDITTTLDPLYQDPYEFGGIVLASELHDIKNSISIFEKGIRNVPTHHKRYWYLLFFNAFNYMYYLDDYMSAAQLLEKASRYPQSAHYLPLLTAKLYAKSDNTEIATTFLNEMINSTNSPELKEKLEFRKKEVMVESDIKIIETARDLFKNSFAKYPEDINELVKHSFLQTIPKEPLGGYYYIDKQDNSIQSSKVERLKVYLKKE